MIKKKIPVLVLFSLCLSLFLSACSLTYQGEYEAGVLRVWTTWPGDRVQFQALFDRYAQENGLTLKVLTGVKSDKIQKALGSATPPEIIILSSNKLVGSYSEQGLIEPLDSLIETAGIDLGDFYAAPLSQCKTENGAHLCLPWGSDVFALYWNKDLFKAAGLDPERPPQTMQELVEYANKLTIRNDQGELSQIGFIPDFPRSHTDLYAHMLDDAWFANGNRLLTANRRALIEAENWQQQFYNTYGFEQANQLVSSLDRYDDSTHPIYAGERLNCQQCHRAQPVSSDKLPENGFYNGKVAMMVDGEWQVGSKYIAAVQPGLNYGVAPFPPPANHSERANATVVQGAVAVIPAKLLDKNSAAKILAWMMSPEVVVDMAITYSSLPTVRSASQDKRFQQIPNFQVFMQLMDNPNAASSVLSALSPKFNQALRETEQELLHNKGGDPEALLNEMQVDLTP